MKEYKVLDLHVALTFRSNHVVEIEDEINKYAQQGYRVDCAVTNGEGDSSQLLVFMSRDVCKDN